MKPDKKKVIAESAVYWPIHQTVLEGKIQILRSTYLMKNKEQLKKIIKQQCEYLERRFLETLKII